MDIIDIEVLDDGQIKFKTSDISDKNHLSADEFLEQIEDLMGSKRQTTPVKHKFWKNKRVLRGGKIVKTSG